MLEKVAHYNDLSDELRKKLQDKIESLGAKVRFSFKISKPNPDKTNYNGPIIWPGNYVLDPRVVNVTDGKSRKRVALVLGTDDKGIPNRFGKISITAGERGIKVFDLTDHDDVDKVALLLLHPKLDGGMNQDKNTIPVVSLIDEVKEAQEKRTTRSTRLKAMGIAQGMSDREVKDFADSQLWDSTQDMGVLRDMIEAMAEETPKMFSDLVEGKDVEFQALVKQALDRQVMSFDPVEYKFSWTDTQQVITVLQPTGDKNEVEKMSTWLQTAGERGDAVTKKLRGLLKKEKAEKTS
jgi:hypothetical protein